jgi:CheY-like chemotaxis protein
MASETSSVNETPLVLVVEDNPKESGLLRLYLEDAGYRVMEAANGKMALEAMFRSKPDMITLDLMMPEMDGFTFLDEKSKHAAYAGIPVVIVSGIAGDLTGAVIGANAFLKKPVRRDELLSIVTGLVPKPGKGGKIKILLIDDDPKAITILSTYFADDRYSLVKAYGGLEGLEAAAANRPDLIVLDLIMPEMNGFEVLDRLGSNEATRGIPVAVLTAKILTNDERKMLSSKVRMIVEKGRFHKDVFMREVRSLISKKQGGGETI